MTTNNEAVSKPEAQETNSASSAQNNTGMGDYTFVHHKARIACYDDPLSEPRIVEVSPAPTREFLTNLAQTIWQQVRVWDSPIPYAVIADVSENFIHANFSEMVVSIFNHGNTIRFSDQGPGIPHKEQAQEWGFSTATEPMKDYIHGVGSGLPRVKEFLACKNGTISIEDNLSGGAVVTISFNETDNDFNEALEEDNEDLDTSLDFLVNETLPYSERYQHVGISSQQGYYPQPAYGTIPPYTMPPSGGMYTQPAPYGYQQPYPQGYPQQYPATPQQPYYQPTPTALPVTQGYYPMQPTQGIPPQGSSYGAPTVDTRALISSLSQRDCQVLLCFNPGSYLRNKEIEELCTLPASTVNNSLKKVETHGLVKKLPNKSRVLTDLGISAVTYLRQNSTPLR